MALNLTFGQAAPVEADLSRVYPARFSDSKKFVRAARLWDFRPYRRIALPRLARR